MERCSLAALTVASMPALIAWWRRPWERTASRAVPMLPGPGRSGGSSHLRAERTHSPRTGPLSRSSRKNKAPGLLPLASSQARRADSEPSVGPTHDLTGQALRALIAWIGRILTLPTKVPDSTGLQVGGF